MFTILLLIPCSHVKNHLVFIAMSLINLQITNFRNIKSANFDLHQKCNLFYGINGSGKTSILEAIYYLGLGRSFRSHIVKRIINNDAETFSIFAKMQMDDNIVPIGIERSLDKANNQIRIAGENISSAAELAKLLPLQLLNQNNHHFFEHGPKARRQFIDWGVFHVEHTFFALWKRVEQIIAQRNALLKTRSHLNQIKLWDNELATLSLDIHNFRKKYLEQLFLLIGEYFKQFLPNVDIAIEYYPGWNLNQNLVDALATSFSRDMQLGYTTVGPQRADLHFTIDHIPAQDMLSRGQQKMLLYSLKLAQGMLLTKLTGKQCIYLVDDLTSELDQTHRQMLVGFLCNLDSQLFVTGIDNSELQALFSNVDNSMFHVERNQQGFVE